MSDENKDQGTTPPEGAAPATSEEGAATTVTETPEEQAARVIAERKEAFKAQLEQMRAQLDEQVKAGAIFPEARDIIMKSEELRLDEDLMSRRGIVQFSYKTLQQFLQTCFEFNTILNGGRIKMIAMGNNYMQDTIDVVICSEELERTKEGEMPPFIRMPEVPFNDFQMLLAIRRRDAKLLQDVLRAAGWDCQVQDAKSKIIVPGGARPV